MTIYLRRHKCFSSSDEGKSIVRIDNLISNNASVAIGDTVVVRKIKAVSARKVILTPLEVLPYIHEHDFPVFKDKRKHNLTEDLRDLRIQAALDHLGREHDVSSVVKNGTHFTIRDGIPGNELKGDVVSLKANLTFL